MIVGLYLWKQHRYVHVFVLKVLKIIGVDEVAKRRGVVEFLGTGLFLWLVVFTQRLDQLVLAGVDHTADRREVQRVGLSLQNGHNFLVT